MDLSKIQIAPDCLREIEVWGKHVVYDVCHGTEFIYPWGLGDWIQFTVLIPIVLILLVMLFLGLKNA